MTPTKENIVDLYKMIDPQDYLQKVSFFRDKAPIICHLDQKHQYFFKYEYVQALFDLGRYEEVLTYIDDIIEYIFLNNIDYRLNTYEHLIFLKTAAHYDLQHYDQAVCLAEQLVGMSPTTIFYQRFLERTYYHQSLHKSQRWRTICMVIILISAILSGVFLMYRDLVPFQYLYEISLGLNAVVILMLVVFYIKHYQDAKKSLESHMKRVKLKDQK
jgi:tetratricopeptide (TPR) repeat protein